MCRLGSGDSNSSTTSSSSSSSGGDSSSAAAKRFECSAVVLRWRDCGDAQSQASLSVGESNSRSSQGRDARTAVVCDAAEDGEEDLLRAAALAERCGLPLVTLERGAEGRPKAGGTREGLNSDSGSEEEGKLLDDFRFALRYCPAARPAAKPSHSSSASSPPPSGLPVLSLFPLATVDGATPDGAKRKGRPRDAKRAAAGVVSGEAFSSRKNPPLSIDLGLVRDTRGGGAELLVKACGRRKKKSSNKGEGKEDARGTGGGRASATEGETAWDLTAGLGRDSTILARDGHFARVVMFERSPAV